MPQKDSQAHRLFVAQVCQQSQTALKRLPVYFVQPSASGDVPQNPLKEVNSGEYNCLYCAMCVCAFCIYPNAQNAHHIMNSSEAVHTCGISARACEAGQYHGNMGCAHIQDKHI